MQKSFYQAKTVKEAIKIYFKGEKELYAQIKNKTIRETMDEIYKPLFWENLKILEVGAGGGIWTNFFLKKGADITCVDINEKILKGNEELHPQAKFILADATTLRLNEKFDLIFVKDVIEHIKDDEKFLSNMNYHLKKDGLILINTQNSFSLNYLIQGSYHFLKGDKNWCGWDPTHVRFYNSKSLERKLEVAGFKPIKWFGSYYFPYRIIVDRLKIRESFFKPLCLVELLGLYDNFPFNFLGWNIGVIAKKIKNV